MKAAWQFSKPAYQFGSAFHYFGPYHMDHMIGPYHMLCIAVNGHNFWVMNIGLGHFFASTLHSVPLTVISSQISLVEDPFFIRFLYLNFFYSVFLDFPFEYNYHNDHIKLHSRLLIARQRFWKFEIKNFRENKRKNRDKIERKL